MPSYYCPQLAEYSESLILEGEEYHHLSRVKRKQIGDIIVLNSAQGILAEAKIIALEKNRAVLEVLSTEAQEAQEPHYALAFALLKNHHDELVIEKCTELGAREFFPLSTQYSVRNEGKNTIARFRKIALSAIKQCDNPYLPIVHETLALAPALSAIMAAGYTPVLCSEKEDQTMLRDLAARQNLCFVIGPEGGFSEAEFVTMQKLQGIRLSPLICRAETAAIAVSAQFVGLNFGLQKNYL